MHYPNLAALLADAPRRLAKGPLALVMVEDDVEVASTLAHLDRFAFRHILVFAGPEIALPDLGDHLTRIDYDTSAETALQNALNGMVRAVPGTWLFYCYNAEYLHYPFCESRTVGEMLSFMTEERRDSVMGYVIDLYAPDLTSHPNGVDRENAHFDKSGYYALALADASGVPLDRQLEIAGGLRWRFEDHIPKDRQRTDRVSFIRAQPGLEMLTDKSLNIPEYNTYACPWHNNLTVAIPSFRTAKALRRNPGSRNAINGFYWPQSERFDWTSYQLLDLGLMEPGQWF